MNNEEKYIARQMFKNKVFQKDGQAYEDFFVMVMQHHNPNFRPVKAHGQFGDRKNDGFDKTTGTYYQVYAPEDLEKRKKKAAEKFKEDFDDLYKYWNDKVTPVREFFYVLNNKYRAVPQIIYPVLEEIKRKYSSVQVDILLNQDLEEIFLNLPDDKIYDIIGYIPDPQNMQVVDFTVMNQVIEYLLSIESSYIKEDIPDKPDFEKKIVFNKLSAYPANLLRTGGYQASNLDEYFKYESQLKEILKKIFNNIYKRGLEVVPHGGDKNDTVFFYILENASPNKKKPVQDAVLVLMSYYFEYCDIFEEPREQAQRSLFE
jgi:hypothetical protein